MPLQIKYNILYNLFNYHNLNYKKWYLQSKNFYTFIFFILNYNMHKCYTHFVIANLIRNFLISLNILTIINIY